MLFGDVSTELAIRYDGDGRLWRAHGKVEFLEPVHDVIFIKNGYEIKKKRNIK